MVENNKLIAEFMGYKYYPYNLAEKEEGLKFGWMRPERRHSNVPFLSKSSKHKNRVLARKHKDLAYHISWSYLMPVVEKCTELWEQYEFDTDERNLMEQEIWHFNNTLSDFLNNDIQAIYRRTIQFIKWYNNERRISNI